MASAGWWLQFASRRIQRKTVAADRFEWTEPLCGTGQQIPIGRVGHVKTLAISLRKQERIQAESCGVALSKLRV